MKADFDIERIQEIEAETRHDVVAFTRAVSETLGEEKKGSLWIDFYGCGKYGSFLSNRQANEIIRQRLKQVC